MDLKVKIIQPNLVWENPKANRKQIEKFLRENKQTADVIVLPEMFTTGFTMNSKEFAEKPNGTTTAWMRSLAAKYNAAIVGSIIVKSGRNFYNRLIWMPPTGVAKTYDKKHLFKYAGEDNHFAEGKKRLIINYKNWRICPQICYDLRFPVWSRNTDKIDLMIYVANWPKARINAWDTLLSARAIENVYYVTGVNRVGKDPQGNEYNGNSAIYNYLGEPLVRVADSPFCHSVTLNKQALLDFRKKFPVLEQRDNFELL